MADDMENEPRFSQAQIRTIAQIVAAALTQDRAQNQTTPASSSQPVVEERQIPELVSNNQASVRNTVPVENDVIKQLAELKDKVEKMSVVKEKDPVTNFHITEYVLHRPAPPHSKHSSIPHLKETMIPRRKRKLPRKKKKTQMQMK
ncbi:hypothetical protein JCGZ_03808 [Jatropha curcas]|uniref:Uncharacterized protein n=1 Tax=Jatropha curcas TaxID=180498 RepID=A0A067L921_JATCU|nr:hypothetical protein JCGZ_03808 [Jatropha curcas]